VQERHPYNNNIIIKSAGPLIMRLIEAAFFITPAIALIALAGAAFFLVNGSVALAALCLLIALLALVGVYARFIAPWQLQIKRINTGDLGISNFQSPASNPLKIVFFSDLHVGTFKGAAWMQRIVEAANAEAPDVVLIGGDFVGHVECSELPAMLAPLAQLKPRIGAFAVMGNHDYGLPDHDYSEILHELLAGMNIRVIHNECVGLRDDLRLLGVDEIWNERDDLAGALARCEACAERTLVLGHNPDLILRLGDDHALLKEHGAFFLFGHTHHGQIHLPFAPGLAIPVKSQFYRGIYHIPYGVMYVSAGVGEGNSPTRLNTWPEIVVFEI
jgi:predicted MPP superfamily phosphohydrolase